MISRLLSLLSGKCPNCEKEKVFIKGGNIFKLQTPKMHSKCKNCGHSFEREPGYFIGAMYVSYGLTVAESIGIFLIVQFFVSSIPYLIGILILSAILLSSINYQYSRLIWMYLFTKKNQEQTV
ncbi:DUF983 domain-containing protein [Aquimarina rhabdastrellae]